MSKKNRRPQPRPAQPTAAIGPASDTDTGPGTLGPGQLETLIGLIATGALDPHLPQLTVAINQRQHHLTTGHTIQALATFAPGDRVRLNHQIQPLYLHPPSAPSPDGPAEASSSNSTLPQDASPPERSAAHPSASNPSDLSSYV
jgi:hypothetical protein